LAQELLRRAQLVVESGPIPESGPMDKATRDALLQHLLGMSFYTAGPKPAIRDALLSLGLPPKRGDANG
jgi:hypothetical protein